ncbi:cytochrome P450 [Lophiostoma macrostomum CBS 122681]|uniref:Cytochrome P450 n=1 Tax=Lophiostoma macrostomum CBS 122681 TaxID=1314788 RepID=A0A6A6T0S8_9PLEO|nr:cytochrome P450 [Lophiostoma macrostomum CBS 122681]
MAQAVVVLALATLLAAIYRFLIYPSLLCPMARIPTLSFTSRFSSLSLLWLQYSGQENRTIYELHRRKGPIIRLAPRVLSLNCFEGGLKQVYLGGFPKSGFYPLGFINYGILPMFAMTNNKEHGARKRAFANVFSKSHILSSESAREVTRAIIFDRLLPLIHQKATKSEAVDVIPLNYAYSMDSFVNWQVGIASGCNFIQNEAERDMYLTAFFDRERYTFEACHIPFITTILEKIGIRLIPKEVDEGTIDIENWNLAMCDKAVALLGTKDDVPPQDFPSVLAQGLRGMSNMEDLSSMASAEKTYPNRLDIAGEMFSDSSAAHETSGVTLSYLFWELSKRPELQTQLRTELRSLDPPLRLGDGGKALPNAKDVVQLPLLDALIMETLRLYPAVPGGQPRVTPAPSNSLGGFDGIPGGVVVQCSAYTVHRNEDVFPDPEAWKPERWLEATPEQLTAMRRWFWAFGSGPSMCIGSNFSLYSMKFCITAIYSNFASTIHDHGDMELMDAYLAGPKGGRLELVFSEAP